MKKKQSSDFHNQFERERGNDDKVNRQSRRKIDIGEKIQNSFKSHVNSGGFFDEIQRKSPKVQQLKLSAKDSSENSVSVSSNSCSSDPLSSDSDKSIRVEAAQTKMPFIGQFNQTGSDEFDSRNLGATP